MEFLNAFEGVDLNFQTKCKIWDCGDDQIDQMELLSVRDAGIRRHVLLEKC